LQQTRLSEPWSADQRLLDPPCTAGALPVQRTRGSAWAQDLPGWAAAYVRHLQTVRKLAEAHDQVVQPQNRADLHAALEAALARLVELRHYLARADLAVAFFKRILCISGWCCCCLAAWRH